MEKYEKNGVENLNNELIFAGKVVATLPELHELFGDVEVTFGHFGSGEVRPP